MIKKFIKWLYINYVHETYIYWKDARDATCHVSIGNGTSLGHDVRDTTVKIIFANGQHVHVSETLGHKIQVKNWKELLKNAKSL